MNLEIRNQLSDAQMEQLKALYEASFPKSEKKPFGMIVKKAASRDMEIFGLFCDGVFAGLLITICSSKPLLIDYFAIDPSLHSQGLGTAFLKKFLQENSSRTVCLEIEDPASEDPAGQKQRRAAFYERIGFETMPYDVSLFGVDMKILCMHGTLSYEEYRQILIHSLGKACSPFIRKKNTHGSH